MTYQYINRTPGPINSRPQKKFQNRTDEVDRHESASPWIGQLAVVDIIQEARTVRTFRLACGQDKHIPFRFEAGQYVDLAFFIEGRKQQRSYSISSSADERRYIDVTINQEQGGLVSGHLFDCVKVRTLIDVRGPLGRFTIDRQAVRSIVLLGAGVGVTPLVSMVRTLVAESWPGSIHVLFGFRTEADGLFVQELTDLAHNHRNLSVHTAWSRPVGRDHDHIGRVTSTLVRRLVRKLRAHTYYLCGPDQMMQDLHAGLQKFGVDESNIHTEAFGNSSSDSELGGQYDLFFEGSGVRVMSRPGESLLQTAERVGVQVDYSCRTGTCGLCQVRLREGEVEMLRDDALTDEELEKGTILTCQSYPRTKCCLDQ